MSGISKKDKEMFERYFTNTKDVKITENEKEMFLKYLETGKIPEEEEEETGLPKTKKQISEHERNKALFEDFIKGGIGDEAKILAEGSLPKLPPRKQIKKTAKFLENMTIDDSLDLHGMTISKAQKILPMYFQQKQAENAKTVIIVHGKGLHSGGFSTLKEFVLSYFKGAGSKFIHDYIQAPRGRGGSGATIVWLRRKNEN